jgi:hypothetical protein
MTLDDKVASGIGVFKSWTTSQMAYSGLPGLSVAVVHDQEVDWSNGYGYADMEEEVKATPDTIVRAPGIWARILTNTILAQIKAISSMILSSHHTSSS